MAQDDPGSELQSERVDGSGDLTAEAASSGVRRPLENPDEGILASPRPPRRRLDPDSSSEHKRASVEEADTEQGSKTQRVSALTHPELADQRMMLYDFRISAVTTKDLLEVPAVVNQDESELLLMKKLENPYLWYDKEFERDL